MLCTCFRAVHCLKKPEDGDDRFLCKTEKDWEISTKLHGIRSHKAMISWQSYFSEHQELKHTNHYTVRYILLINYGAQPLQICMELLASHWRALKSGHFPSHQSHWPWLGSISLYSLVVVSDHLNCMSLTIYIDHMTSQPRSPNNLLNHFHDNPNETNSIWNAICYHSGNRHDLQNTAVPQSVADADTQLNWLPLHLTSDISISEAAIRHVPLCLYMMWHRLLQQASGLTQCHIHPEHGGPRMLHTYLPDYTYSITSQESMILSWFRGHADPHGDVLNSVSKLDSYGVHPVACV
jgi:hypothetical protein